MRKADFLHQKKLNPADELREILSSLEDRRVKLKSMNATQVLILLRDLDAVYRLFDQLETTGLNLLPEQGRFNVIQARLKKRAALLLNGLGGPNALSELRPSPSPPPEQWWWYIHDLVIQDRQRLIKRVTIGMVIFILLLAASVITYNTFLAPSPEVVARLNAENNAFDAAEVGDYREAIVILDEGLAQVPGDPGLLIFKGILHETVGQDSKAIRSFRQAQTNLNDPITFHLGRGRLKLRLNQPGRAEQDARLALELDEDSPGAWLLLGNALEFQDARFEAVPAYEKAGQLALENGDSQTVVLARMALGRISGSP